MRMQSKLDSNAGMKPAHDPTVPRVGVALAILKALDSGALDVASVRRVVGQECGLQAAQLYFAQALDDNAFPVRYR